MSGERRPSSSRGGRPLWHYYVAGGIGDVCAVCVSHPLDVVKVRQQLTGELTRASESKGIVQTASAVRAAEGLFSGLYRGISASIARQASFSTLRHGGYATICSLLVGSSVCGYASVSLVLLLIKLYGATVTELVKSLRKVLTVVLSFVLYPKPLSYKYALGGAAVLASLVATHELQRRKGGDVKQPPPKPAAAFKKGGKKRMSLAERAAAEATRTAAAKKRASSKQSGAKTGGGGGGKQQQQEEELPEYMKHCTTKQKKDFLNVITSEKAARADAEELKWRLADQEARAELAEEDAARQISENAGRQQMLRELEELRAKNDLHAQAAGAEAPSR